MFLRLASLTLCLGFSVSIESRGDDSDDAVRVVSVASIGRPVVARTDRDGTIHLLCDSDEGPRYARSSDQGATFSAPIPVVVGGSTAAGLEYNVWDLAIGRGGRVFVALGTNAWKLKLPKDEWGYFLSTFEPGASAFSPVRNLNRKPSEGFSIAADDQGNVTACWLADKLYANLSHDDGATFEPSAELNPLYNPCNCCTTSATYGRDGKLAVLYREETGNERDMYIVLWDQARGMMSRERVGRTNWKIDACPMTYFAIAPDRAGYVVAWPTAGPIFFARADGQARSVEPSEIQTPGRSGMRTGVVALAAPDGKTLVAWKLDKKIGWQLYDEKGKPQGPPGSSISPGTGAAGVVLEGRFVLFR